MRKLFTGVLIALAVVFSTVAVNAEEGPLTFYGSAGGTTTINEEAAIESASLSFRLGIKTNLNAEGTWRLITEYNSVDIALKKDVAGNHVKSIGVGAERYYWLGVKDGFFSNSCFVARGALDFELNMPENATDVALGIGWLKKLSADAEGSSLLAMQVSLDMRIRDDEKDDLALFGTINLTPPILR